MYNDGTFITKCNDRVRQNEPISHVLLCYHYFLWRFSYEKKPFWVLAHDKWKGVSLILILFKCSTSFFSELRFTPFFMLCCSTFCASFLWSIINLLKKETATSRRKISKISPVYCAFLHAHENDLLFLYLTSVPLSISKTKWAAFFSTWGTLIMSWWNVPSFTKRT